MIPRKALVLFATLASFAIAFVSCSKQPAASQPAATPQSQAVASPPPIQVTVPQQPVVAPSPPPPGAPAAPDTSTPKKAALAFANAAAAGDTASMQSLAAGTGSRMFGYYAAFAEVVSSQHIFVAALKVKFGDDIELPPEIEHLGNLPPMPSNYDALTEKIDGDNATLVDATGHAGVKLKKVGDTWKVDFDAEEAALPPDMVEGFGKAQEEFAAIKKGFDQVSAKILDGTYTDSKTAVDAVMAMLGHKQ